jgi:hypothetical protein
LLKGITLGSSLDVVWNEGEPPAGRAAGLLTNPDRAAPAVTDPGPTHPVLLCSYGSYAFRDASGNMNLRYNCPFHNINWSWTMSPTLLAIATGACTENGMKHSVNGVLKSQNAQHVIPCNYIFHGTLPRIYNADTVYYSDDIYFPVRGGTAHVHVYGTVIASRS